jgi:alkylhydroperoxidase/carboxymuconolactone decarboxylase family protein YurZ
MERKKQITLSDNELERIEELYKLWFQPEAGFSNMRAKLKEEFPFYWEKGIFSEILINKAIKEKNSELIEIAIDTASFPNSKEIGLNLMYKLLREDWHYSYEEIVNTLAAVGNLDSLPAIRETVLLNPESIDSFAMHNTAIRTIFDIAGKDALPILLGLRQEIDEEISPTLEKIIKRCQDLQ